MITVGPIERLSWLAGLAGDADVPEHTLRLAIVVAEVVRSDSPARVPQRVLASALGVSGRTVRRQLAALEGAGWLHVKQGHGRGATEVDLVVRGDTRDVPSEGTRGCPGGRGHGDVPSEGTQDVPSQAPGGDTQDVPSPAESTAEGGHAGCPPRGDTRGDTLRARARVFGGLDQDQDLDLTPSGSVVPSRPDARASATPERAPARAHAREPAAEPDADSEPSALSADQRAAARKIDEFLARKRAALQAAELPGAISVGAAAAQTLAALGHGVTADGEKREEQSE